MVAEKQVLSYISNDNFLEGSLIKSIQSTKTPNLLAQ